MRSFIENYLHFMKNCIRPPYEKLKSLKSAFIENSNFENNRDPWEPPNNLLAKRAGPKGLRAESARAFTGRRNSHSGRGEDFLSRQPNFFTETAVTPERKVEKWFPRWEINRHAEG